MKKQMKKQINLSYKARRGLSLLVLLVFMPFYIVACVSIFAVLPALPIFIELPMYVVMGIGWVFPFRRVFLGVGKEDPDAAASSPDDSEQ